MANIDNLIPNSERTPSELREIASKGGKASGKKRRQMKTFKELCDKFINGKITNEKLKEQLKVFGITDKDSTYKMAMIVSLVNKSLKGDVKAFEVLRDTVGEKPIEQIQNINPPIINLERPAKDD